MRGLVPKRRDPVAREHHRLRRFVRCVSRLEREGARGMGFSAEGELRNPKSPASEGTGPTGSWSGSPADPPASRASSFPESLQQRLSHSIQFLVLV